MPNESWLDEYYKEPTKKDKKYSKSKKKLIKKRKKFNKQSDYRKRAKRKK
tara:strand:- start:2520 stop:2669 length:150 start_codon:yes stop_codon:yes gene_type:complete